MSTTAQNSDTASTDTEPDALVDWSAFTLKASGPATRLAVDDDDGDWCAQTETTLHVKRQIEDYEDILAFLDTSRERQTRYFESSETNRSDDHQLGDHHAEDWDVHHSVRGPTSTTR